MVLQRFNEIFETMNTVFFFLRILSPTPIEIENIRKAISVLETLWNEMELKYSPKAYILLFRTLDQIDRFGGIADLVEDFIEKFHQTDHLVVQMSSQCFRQQELCKIRRQCLSNNPFVQTQIATVTNG